MSVKAHANRLADWVALGGGVITACVGGLFLVRWVLGLDAFTILGIRFVPMAPNSAVIFAVLGGTVLFRDLRPTSPGGRRVTIAAALFAAGLASATLLGLTLGFSPDEWLIPRTHQVAERPAGISPFTAVALLLAGVSLLLTERQARTWAASLGIVVALGGAVGLIGYWFVMPDLHGVPFVPMSLPTALTMMALGAALTASARPDPWPLHVLIGAGIVAVFLMDCLTPLGWAVWILYLLPLLLTAWLPSRRAALLVAATAIGLLVAGFFLSSPGIAAPVAIFNRSVGGIILWVTAALLVLQKRAAAVVRESESRLRLSAEAANVGLWDWDVATSAVHYSPEWKRQIGYRDDEITNHFSEWQSRVHPDDLAPTLATVQAYLANPVGRHEAEFRFRHKDGSYRWIYTHADVQLDAAGKPVRMLGCHVDITARKQAEETLRKQHAELENLYATTPVGLALIDRDLRFVRINERLAAINGRPVAAHLGRTVAEVLPALAPVLLPIYRRVLDTGESVLDLEIHGTTPAEPKVPRDWLASYHPARAADGSVGGVAIAVVEITEQKQAATLVLEAQRQLTSLIANLPGVVYRCRNDRNWTTEFVSEGVLQLLGYPAADFMERRREVGQFVHPDDQVRVWEEVQAALRERRHWELTYRVLPAGGGEKWVWEQGGGVYDASGTLLALEGFVTDITARKQAEAALREGERSLSEAQHIAHVGSWSWNLAGPVRWTDELYRIYGVSPATFTPTVEEFFKLVHPEDRPAMQEWLRACSAGESPAEFEFRAVRPDGTERFVSGRGQLVRDAEGRAVQMVGTAQDITERKLSEAALHEAEARLRLSVTASNIGLWDWNMTSHTVVFSREWKSQLGYAEDEILDRFGEWESRVHPDDLAPTQAKLQRFIENPAAQYAVEFRMRHKDGSWRWIYTRAQIFRDTAGIPARMVGCHVDITERKRAEEAVRESEARFAAAFRSNPAGVSISTFEDGRFIEVNPAFLRIFNLTREQVIGRTAVELGVLDSGRRREIIDAVRRDGFVRDWEIPFRRADGAEGHSVRSVERLRLGEQDCLLTLIVDVTERKQAEREVAESREQLRALLVRLQGVRDQESLRISREIHDVLGHLLTGLKLELRAMEKPIASVREEALREALAARLAAARQLGQSTVDAVKKIALELRPAVLEQLGLAAALDCAAREFTQHNGIPCHLSVPDPMPALEPDRAAAVFRIFEEALTNIARHAAATEVRARLACADGRLVLEVSDNGRGLPAGGTAGKPGSLGVIGMRERAFMAGGELRLHGPPGEGTTVTVSLPLPPPTS